MTAEAHDEYLTRLHGYIARHAERLLEGGLSTGDYRLMIGHARSVAKRTGTTVEAVLAYHGIRA